ncbi:MAG: type 4a pilus biogenesis protein PilO [Bacillota bacterium]
MKWKYKLCTTLLLVLVVLSIALLLNLSPQVGEVLNMQEQLTTKQNNLQQLQKELTSKKNVLETKLEDSLANNKLLEIIPYQLQTNQFLDVIRRLLAETKVTLNKYVPQEIVKTESYIKLPIFLELTGDYQAVKSFFRELEELNRLVTIEKIKLYQAGEKFKTDLKIAIYSLTEVEDSSEK